LLPVLTPLFVALENEKKSNNNVEMVSLLLEKGADVNHVDDCGCIPLHYAICHSSDLEVVKLLIEYGSKINKIDNEKCTPLDMAVINSNIKIEIIELLLANGAKFRFSIKSKLNNRKIHF
jgi:ankyrin repeat protein